MKKHVYIGTLHETYDSGIGVVSLDSDFIRYQRFYGEQFDRLQRAALHYNRKGEPYFCSRGHRYYLNEFMRVDYGKEAL